MSNSKACVTVTNVNLWQKHELNECQSLTVTSLLIWVCNFFVMTHHVSCEFTNVLCIIIINIIYISYQGLQICRKPLQNKPLWHNCSKQTPCIYNAKKSRCVWQNTFSLKFKGFVFKSSLLSCHGSISVTLMLGCEVSCYVEHLLISTWQLPGQGQMKSVVVHCLHQFLAKLLVSCCSFVCTHEIDHILLLICFFSIVH